MLKFCKAIKEVKPTYQADGQDLQIYATPSKPFAQRQKEAAASIKFDTIKRVVPPEVADALEFEVGKGRGFYKRQLLEARPSPTQDIQYLLPALQTHWADLTAEKLQEEEDKVRQERSAKRLPA